MNRKILTIEQPGIEKLRIDKYIADEIKLFSRSQIRQRNVKVFINNKLAKLSKHVSTGDKIELTFEDLKLPDIKPENIDLDIIFENKDIIVINKPQGMVVHPANGNYSGTLVNALLYYSKSVKTNFFNEKLRPGIVHRLDKETSGVIIVAKNIKCHSFLSEQFQKRITKKTYLAVIKGKPDTKNGIIEKKITRNPHNRKKFTCAPDKGKESLTKYKIIRKFDLHSFVKLQPESGRTHQLRVHLLSIRCPILGDPLYGRKSKLYPEIGMMLHAYKLEIFLPEETKKRVFFAALPVRFKKFLSSESNSHFENQ